jgi:3-dehydroquinate dehydratase/shikimate dehydrogenase
MFKGLPRVCVTVAGNSLAELRKRAYGEVSGLPAGDRFLELRLDYLAPAALQEPRGLAKLIRDLRRRRVALIVTLRSVAAGGKFQGSAEEQWQILSSVADAGPSLVDLEVESAEHLGQAAVRRLRQLAPLMISFHDYQETPTLSMALARLRHFPADYYKLVTQANDPLDNAAVLDLLAGGRGRLVAFTMGEIGKCTRVMCLAAGAPFTYAAALGGGVPGIGQIPAAMMRGMYRADRIGKRTRVLGVVGHPIGHSLSPVVHNVALAALDLNWVYVAFEAPHFDNFWTAFRARLAGLSITMPHKEAAARAADERDPASEAAGAANTLVRRDGHWRACNTDVVGLLRPLERRMKLLRMNLKGARVLVAGAGGAARAAVSLLTQAGCRVSVVNRTPEKAAVLAAILGGEVVLREDLARLQWDAIVHTTPLGMTGDSVNDCFFRPAELNTRILFETVYTPATTHLMRMAERRGGIEVISGVEMFLAQAVEQFRLWTGKKAPENVMEDALRAALPR